MKPARLFFAVRSGPFLRDDGAHVVTLRPEIHTYPDRHVNAYSSVSGSAQRPRFSHPAPRTCTPRPGVTPPRPLLLPPRRRSCGLTKSQPRTGHKFKLPVQNTGGNRETATQAHGSSTHSVTGTSHARLHARAQRTATELHMTTHGVRCMDADTMAAGGRVPQLRTPNSELNRHRGPMRVLKSMGPVFKPATRKPAGSARHLQRLTSCNPSGSRSTIHHTPCHTRSRQETLSKRARCTMDGWSVGARYCAFSCSRQLLHCHATIHSFTTIVIIKCDLEAVADDLPHLTRRE